MNNLLRACNTQEEAYQVVALTVRELFPGQNGGLAIFHPSGRYLETVAEWGNEIKVEPLFSLEDCWALRRGQPHIVMEPGAGLLCRHFVQPPQFSYLCIPLTVQGETLGGLYLIDIATREESHWVSQQQLAVMVGEAITLSLSNLRLREKLHEQAMRDPLTGLFNRRYLDETLPRELHRTQRENSPLCMVMLDLDHFKELNDTFGHELGDLVLTELGQIIHHNLRKSDIACRQGGDEFLLVLPEASLADTKHRVEQIRLLVKRLEIQQVCKITISAGIVEAAVPGPTASELLRAVDKAMYAAKHAGRDCIVVYQPVHAQGFLKNFPQVGENNPPHLVDVGQAT